MTLPDVDTREGLGAIQDTITAVHEGQPYEVWNSDEDMVDEPAPRVIMVSAARYEELLETEWMYKDLL